MTKQELWLSHFNGINADKLVRRLKRVAYHVGKTPQDAEDSFSYGLECTFRNIWSFDESKGTFEGWLWTNAVMYLKYHTHREEPIEIENEQPFEWGNLKLKRNRKTPQLYVKEEALKPLGYIASQLFEAVLSNPNQTIRQLKESYPHLSVALQKRSRYQWLGERWASPSN